MFTGLVEEIGTIKEYKSIPDGKEAWIEGHIVIDDLKKMTVSHALAYV